MRKGLTRGIFSFLCLAVLFVGNLSAVIASTDIEDSCLECFKNGDFGLFTQEELRTKYNIQRQPAHKDYSKSIWKMLLKFQIKTQAELFETISEKNHKEVQVFRDELRKFLQEGIK